MNKEGPDATNKPRQPAPLSHHHYEASSPAQCNHNLSLLDAGQLAHQISPKLVYTTLTYPYYTPDTSHTHTNLWRLLIQAFCCRHPPYTTVDQHLEGCRCSLNCQNTCGFQEETSHIIQCTF